MPIPRTTYLSFRPSGAGRALLGISLASLSRFLAGVYVCVCFVGRALTEPAMRARADTVAESMKRMVTRVEGDVKEDGRRKVDGRLGLRLK